MALARHDQKRLKMAMLVGLVFHVLLFAFFSFYRWDRYVKSPVYGALLVEIGDQRVIPQVQNPASETQQPQTAPETSPVTAAPGAASPPVRSSAAVQPATSNPGAPGGQTSSSPAASTQNEAPAKPVTDPFAPVPLRESVGKPGVQTGPSTAAAPLDSSGTGSGVDLKVLEGLTSPGSPTAATPSSGVSQPGVSTDIPLEGGGRVTLTGAQGRKLDSVPAAKPIFPSEIPQGLLTVEFQVDDLGNIRTNSLKISFKPGTLPGTTLVQSALKRALDQWKFSPAPGSALVSVSVTFIVEKN